MLAYGVDVSTIFWSIIAAAVCLVTLILTISLALAVGVLAFTSAAALSVGFGELIVFYSIPLSYAAAMFMSIGGIYGPNSQRSARGQQPDRDLAVAGDSAGARRPAPGARARVGERPGRRHRRLGRHDTRGRRDGLGRQQQDAEGEVSFQCLSWGEVDDGITSAISRGGRRLGLLWQEDPRRDLFRDLRTWRMHSPRPERRRQDDPPPDAGGDPQALQRRVEINGISSQQKEARRQIDYITHLDGIPEGMNVHDGLKFYSRVEGGTEEDVQRVIELLGLKELARMRFAQLSQGQKKRVSVARDLPGEKSVYLLDEPTSNLDPKVAREIRDLVLQLSEDKVVLYSSHNLFEAREIGSRVIAVKGGEARAFWGRSTR